MLKMDTEMPGTLMRKYVPLTFLKQYTATYKGGYALFQAVSNRVGTAEDHFQFQGIRV
jgi:hypothetical protein